MAPDTLPAGPAPAPTPVAAAPAATPAATAAPAAAAERKIDKLEARQRLVVLSQQVEALKVQEQNLEERKKKLAPIKNDLQGLQAQVLRQRGEREQDPDWDALRKDIRETERRANLADNPVMEAAERSGVTTMLTKVSEGFATVGSKIADGWEVASEYVIKPVGASLSVMWAKITEAWKGLGHGTRKAFAGILRLFGKEEWAQKIEGVGGQMETQFAETVEKLKMQLRDNEELELASDPLRDRKSLEAIRRNYDMLPRLIQTEKYKTIESYVYTVIRQKKPAAAAKITLQEIVKATELFNGDKAERDKDLAEARANQPTVTAQPAATTAPATPATPPSAGTTSPRV